MTPERDTTTPVPSFSITDQPEWWESYHAGWQAAQTLFRQRLVRVAERLNELDPVMTGEAKAAADEVRTMVLLLIAR